MSEAKNLRALLREKNKPFIQDVEIEELGVTVFLKRMSAKERYEYYKLGSGDSGVPAPILLLSKTLCDENGNLLYTNSKKDLEEIGELSGTVTDQLQLVAQDINKMGQRYIEELVKKYAPAQSDDSISD